MNITKRNVAQKIENYLNHKISKEELIDWCEHSMQEDTFEDHVAKEITARLGLMDAKNFDVSYEDLSAMLDKLGYHVKVEIL